MVESVDKSENKKKPVTAEKNKEILDNVVYLDNFNIMAPPQSLSEMKTGIEEYRKKFARDVAVDITKLAVYELMRAGAQFNTEDENTNKMINFLAETVSALYLYSCNVDHPIQELAEDYSENSQDVIILDDEDDEY